jgi:ArsR family transcriptional regulator
MTDGFMCFVVQSEVEGLLWLLRKKQIIEDCKKIFQNKFLRLLYFVLLRNTKYTMNIPYSDNQVKLARFAKAMGHPARIKILEILSDRGCCYSGNIADEFPIALSTLSQHLKELKSSGLIQGEINPPFIKYCINKENWKQAKFLFDIFLSDKSVKATSCNVG